MPLGFTLESQDQHHQKPWPRGKGFRYVASVQTHVQTDEFIRSFRCVWWKRLQQCKLQHTHKNTPPILQRSPGRASHSTNCCSVDCRSQQKGHHRSTREGSRWPTKALAKALAGSATSCIINRLLNKFNTGNHGSMLSNKTCALILPHLCDPPPMLPFWVSHQRRTRRACSVLAWVPNAEKRVALRRNIAAMAGAMPYSGPRIGGENLRKTASKDLWFCVAKRTDRTTVDLEEK